MLRAVAPFAFAAALLTGCDKPGYRYADDVKVQFSENDSVASIKAQLGCEGAHPEKESDSDKTEREKRVPKTDVGKAWLEEACRIADEFDAAGPVTSWPDDKAVWAGERICRPQISRVVEKIDETSFARMGRVEIQKGQGDKLWIAAPDIDRKDKVLGYNFLVTDVAFRVTEAKLGDIDAFFKALASGEHPDVETLRKDENASDRETSDAVDKIVGRHTVRGSLVASEGTSTLAYPVLGEKGDPSAIHYLRQKGDKLLVASPLNGASQPSACVAELMLQK
jgi:hypothetical protein